MVTVQRRIQICLKVQTLPTKLPCRRIRLAQFKRCFRHFQHIDGIAVAVKRPREYKSLLRPLLCSCPQVALFHLPGCFSKLLQNVQIPLTICAKLCLIPCHRTGFYFLCLEIIAHNGVFAVFRIQALQNCVILPNPEPVYLIASSRR